MLEFFSESGGLPFNLFDIQHIAVTIVTIIAVLLIYFNREKLKKFKHMKALRYSVAILLFINMAIFYIIFIVNGEYTWKEHLPLHLCFITGYLFMFVLITGNKKLFKIVYFFTILGPLPAIVWPEIAQGCNRFIFWQFFISHHFLIISSMFCLFVLDYKVEKRDMYRAFFYGNVYFFIMYIFNLIFGTNYVMSTELPKHVVAIYPFLEYLNYPIIWLEITGIAAVLLAYIPVKIINKKHKEEAIIRDTFDKDELQEIHQS